MPTPILHYHPLSSYCQKALIAAELLAVPLDKRLLNLGDAAEREAFLGLWPLGKMPVLVDQGQVVPESSIIIEHLQVRHAAPERRLIPADPAQALQVRLWDRLFDQCVMTPMQALTSDLLRPPEARDPAGVARARAGLQSAYVWIDQHLAGRVWAASPDFSLADCAAAPALFYALCYEPLPDSRPHLAAYFERLVAHPAVAHTLAQARPFLQCFPGRAGLARRFFDPEVDGPPGAAGA